LLLGAGVVIASLDNEGRYRKVCPSAGYKFL
jgi:hypothetical protein